MREWWLLPLSDQGCLPVQSVVNHRHSHVIKISSFFEGGWFASQAPFLSRQVPEKMEYVGCLMVYVSCLYFQKGPWSLAIKYAWPFPSIIDNAIKRTQCCEEIVKVELLKLWVLDMIWIVVWWSRVWRSQPWWLIRQSQRENWENWENQENR